MSEARPITNITDFVCGSCWNSFSREDPGAVRDGQIVCPHCGHVLPVEAGGGDIASLVRAAPSNALESDAFAANPPPPRRSSSLDDGFPDLDKGDSYGWLPPDVGAPSEPAGFVVGEPDDFDFNEPTLRPDVSHDDLLAAVRGAPPRPLSGEVRPPAPGLGGSGQGPAQGGSGWTGDELGVDVDEPTPIDAGVAARLAEGLQSAPGEGDADDELPADAGAELDPRAEQDPRAELDPAELDAELLKSILAAEAGAEEEDVEHRDWKLKAMGLTYNFHGLDPLIGWASNKAGQPLQISLDGAVWKDFGTFFAAYKDGVPAARAFLEAAEPGAAPPPSEGGRQNRSTVNKLPNLAEAQGATANPAAPAPVLAPVPVETPAAPKTPPVSKGPVTPAAASGRSPTLNGPAAGRPSATTPASRQIGPNSSPSRRTPVAAAQNQKKDASPAKIAFAVALIAVVVVAILHAGGVVTIPGLPKM